MSAQEEGAGGVNTLHTTSQNRHVFNKTTCNSTVCCFWAQGGECLSLGLLTHLPSMPLNQHHHPCPESLLEPHLWGVESPFSTALGLPSSGSLRWTPLLFWLHSSQGGFGWGWGVQPPGLGREASLEMCPAYLSRHRTCREGSEPAGKLRKAQRWLWESKGCPGTLRCQHQQDAGQELGHPNTGG